MDFRLVGHTNGLQSNYWVAQLSGIALEERGNMLWTLMIILLILWALGMYTGYILVGFIHLLLILALIILLYQLVGGRRPIDKRYSDDKPG